MLKSLSTGEMVALTEPLITKNSPQRKAVMATAELAAIMPRVDEVHVELIATQPKQSSAALAALTEEALKRDARHDGLARSIVGVISAFAQSAPTAEESRALLELSDVLFPDGMMIVNRSLREESGAARLLEQRLTREHRAALQKLPLPGDHTVLELVDEYIAVGKELGALEDRRTAEQTHTSGQAPADVVRVRNKWIRSVNALTSMAELVEMPADTWQLVFGPLRAAEKAADQRRHRRAGNPDQPEVPEVDPRAPTHNP